MNTVLRTLVNKWLLFKAHQPGRALWLLVYWVAAIYAVETLGPEVRGDVADLLIGLPLGLLVGVTITHHLRSPLFWLSPAERVFRVLLAQVLSTRFKLGLDFREHPTVRRRVPPLLWGAAMVLASLTATVALGLKVFPGAARSTLLEVSYTLTLLASLSLWGMLVLASLVFVVIALTPVHDYLVQNHRGPGRRSLPRELACHSLLVIALVAGALLLPDAVPMVVLALCAHVVVGCHLVLPPLNFLWRPHGRQNQVHSLSLRCYALYFMAITALTLALLTMLSRGDRLLGGGSDESLVTATLGTIFLWATMAGCAALTWRWLLVTRIAQRRNPTVTPVPEIHVLAAPESERGTIRKEFVEQGWLARFVDSAPSNSVCVQLGEGRNDGIPDVYPPPPEWPREVHRQELTSSRELQRYERRLHLQHRRQLFRGLQKLFKNATARDYQQGEGYWVGLQHWFVTGLTRDSQEEEADLENDTLLDGIIGQPYHQVFAQPVRHHFWQVQRALEIDLIFVEDGVKFRSFRKVLESLFEIYDVHGGRERAEDHMLVGVPGVRAMFHDFVLDDPIDEEEYPEPDYDEIGRARILHIYKDRGDAFENLTIPTDWENIPVGSAY